jgi:hypothetical protein
MPTLDDYIWTNPRSVPLIEGVGIPFDLEVEGAEDGAITSQAATVYDKHGNDVTSTVMPSGSHTVSGNRISFKKLTALDPELSPYLALWDFTFNGADERRKTQFIVQSKEQAG